MGRLARVGTGLFGLSDWLKDSHEVPGCEREAFNLGTTTRREGVSYLAIIALLRLYLAIGSLYGSRLCGPPGRCNRWPQGKFLFNRPNIRTGGQRYAPAVAITGSGFYPSNPCQTEQARANRVNPSQTQSPDPLRVKRIG